MSANLSEKRSPCHLHRSIWLLLCCMLLSSCKAKPDITPPQLLGISDLTVYVGEGIAYRNGVSAIDDRDGKIDFEVLCDSVKNNIPGQYQIFYRATDAAGNTTEKSAIVTIRRPEVNNTLLFSYVDPILAQKGFLEMDRADACEALYYYIKGIMSYHPDSDKTDWEGEALRGLTKGVGDCFTYYAVARLFFERMEMEYLTVERTKGVLPTTHFWFLINMGSAESPLWYHWDCCPHEKELPFKTCLLTDAQLLAYNQKAPHYYDFDAALYPATPIEPFQK